MKSFRDFWSGDRGLTALLVVLAFTLIVAPVLVAAGLPIVFFEILLSLILISGITSISGRRWLGRLVIAVAILSLALRWVRISMNLPGLDYYDATMAFLAFLILAALVLFQVLGRKGPVTTHRVLGSVAAYLLLGFAWANAYWLVLLGNPAAFRFPDGHADRLGLYYFSFVTLATLGYGDITPTIAAARSLAIAEGLVGQLFPAILIARLVSLEIMARTDAKPKS